MDETSFDLLEEAKFINQSKLNTYKNIDTGRIERLMSIPSNLRKQYLNDYLHKQKNSWSVDKKVKLTDYLNYMLDLFYDTVSKLFK